MGWTRYGFTPLHHITSHLINSNNFRCVLTIWWWSTRFMAECFIGNGRFNKTSLCWYLMLKLSQRNKINSTSISYSWHCNRGVSWCNRWVNMARIFYKRCLPGMIVVISTFIINTNTLPKKQYHRLAAKAAIPMPNVTYNQLLLNKIQQNTMPHITAWGFIQCNRNINYLLVCICPVSSGDNTLPKSQVWDITFFIFSISIMLTLMQ